MILNQPQTQVLGGIADGLAGSDPKLASMLNIFSRLAAGEEMPAHEKIRVRRGWPMAHRLRHARRPRLGWQHAMLLLWAAISAVLLASALFLNASSHNACIQSTGAACSSASPTT